MKIHERKMPLSDQMTGNHEYFVYSQTLPLFFVESRSLVIHFNLVKLFLQIFPWYHCLGAKGKEKFDFQLS